MWCGALLVDCFVTAVAAGPETFAAGLVLLCVDLGDPGRPPVVPSTASPSL